MVIDIIIKDEDENVLGKRQSHDFEGAEEDLGKLQRMFEAQTENEIDEELLNKDL